MDSESTRQLRQGLFGIWCAPIFSAMVLVGWLGIAHFWRPAPADLGPEATKEFFTVTHRTGMIWGNSILLVACVFLVIASIQFGLVLAEIEGRRPLWSITTAVGGILIALIVFLDATFWISAAYRPAAGADVVVALNDLSWLGFLLGWVFLSLQMVASALVTLGDRSPNPAIPRWVAKLSLVGAALLACAGGPAFTHTGPFAYHGLLAFYMPMAIWGLWLDAHAFYLRRALRKSLAESNSKVHPRPVPSPSAS